MSERAAERRHHDEVLAYIARFAGSSFNLQEVLDRIAERSAALTGADRANIWLLDRSGRYLMPSALYGMDAAFTEGWKRRPLAVDQEPLSEEVLETGRPLVIVDAATDPRTDKASVDFFGDRSILVAPLISRGRVLGTLFLNHVRSRYDFSDDDVATTTAIANQAAIAIDNARLQGDTRRLAEQLRRSFRLAGELLAGGGDLQQSLQMMVQLAVETVGADGGSIRLLAEGARESYLAASAGTARAAEMSVAETDLVAGGQPLGSLVFWRVAPAFDDQERELLAAFAGHARTAIEHTRLYLSLQEERARTRHAERAQADFHSMVSHELRTPLALIKGYVATLLNPALAVTPEMAHRFIDGIDSASDRLGRLIDNLLSAARLETEVFDLHPRPVEVGQMLHEAIDSFTWLAAGRQVVLEMAPGEMWVLADADRLFQVLENLVSNAMKYAPGEAPVLIRASQVAGHVRIMVQDSGPGIPESALELIFEKYFRVASQPGPAGESDAAGEPDGHASGPVAVRQRGLGLGLYICRRILEKHGGRIWAENGPSGGSAFHLELPLGTGSEVAPLAHSASPVSI